MRLTSGPCQQRHQQSSNICLTGKRRIFARTPCVKFRNILPGLNSLSDVWSSCSYLFLIRAKSFFSSLPSPSFLSAVCYFDSPFVSQTYTDEYPLPACLSVCLCGCLSVCLFVCFINPFLGVMGVLIFLTSSGGGGGRGRGGGGINSSSFLFIGKVCVCVGGGGEV